MECQEAVVKFINVFDLLQQIFLLLPLDVPVNLSYNISICPFVNHFFKYFIQKLLFRTYYKFKELVDFSIKVLE
jgi:hypothetical protein